MGDALGARDVVSSRTGVYLTLVARPHGLKPFEDFHRLRGGDFSYYLNWMNYKTTAFQVVQKHCAEYQKFREPARFEKVGHTIPSAACYGSSNDCDSVNR